jgi:nucleoside-diphosphate-sugar epimerase
VRPSLTYGDTQIPMAVNSWTKPYTIVERMLKGKKVIVPGDGTSLWVITHNTDFAKGFVGLIGNKEAIGEALHITSEEVRTWDQYYNIVADTLGVDARIVHIPSDFIVACVPEMEGTLIGDKSVSCVFDNSKIRRFVPDYRATTCFAEGIRRTVAWFNADPARQVVDAEYDAMCDKLINAYERGLEQAVEEF